MGAHHFLRNGEAKPPPLLAQLQVFLIFGLVKFLKDLFGLAGMYAYASILHQHIYIFPLAPKRDLHALALRGELYGVVHQVHEHLRKPELVAVHQHALGQFMHHQFHPFFLGVY
ncbi:MAG TPA: hypothetical protein DEQ38_11775 [Elusimicrobia bacterium]|nr:hypothetical protein [Elusimicrobiota bacterium]